jgi:hypothetical protein
MNDVLSLGIHRCWKTSFVDDIGAIRPVKTFNDDGTIKESAPKVLDVAGIYL